MHKPMGELRVELKRPSHLAARGEDTAGGRRADEASILGERGSYDTRAGGVVSRWLHSLDNHSNTTPATRYPATFNPLYKFSHGYSSCHCKVHV